MIQDVITIPSSSEDIKLETPFNKIHLDLPPPLSPLPLYLKVTLIHIQILNRVPE